jgi:anti-sigma factor RsiW
MESYADRRQLLRAYLLGRLNAPNEERRRALAERCFEDDARYEEFTEVEDELLDQYVLGRLSPEDRAGFASYLAHLPKHAAREKLAFVQALARAAAERGPANQPATGWFGAGAMASAAASDAASWPGSLKPLLWRYSLPAAMVLAGVVLAWLLFYNQRLQQTNKQLQAGLDQGARRQQESQQTIETLQNQSAAEREQLLADLGRAREENQAQARRLAELQSAAAPSSPLLTGADEKRGGLSGEKSPSLARISLKPGASSLRLDLRLPAGERHQLIEARLTETGAREKEVWKLLCEPACEPAIANQILSLQLPAGHLASGRHRLSLLLRAADGLVVSKGYDFILVKR